MADDKKSIPEAAPPAETPAPTVENVAVPEQPAPEPVLTDAEAVMLEHEGQAAFFEMGNVRCTKCLCRTRRSQMRMRTSSTMTTSTTRTLLYRALGHFVPKKNSHSVLRRKCELEELF